MASEAELALLLSAHDSNFSKVVKDADKVTGGLGKTMQDVGKIAGGFLAANVVAGGVQQLTGFIGDSIGAIKDSIMVNAQLDAVLKSTGGTAGVTAKQVQDMAGNMEKLSLFEDEAIISSSSLLLTFTKIGQDVFPRAQQGIIDMAQAMNMDLQSATTMVGKALNDPIAGITAMSRAGIQFTEDQKEMIKAMVEGGDTAGAQAMILKELETQFGGSAKAASDAAGQSEAYKDRMAELQEEIGSKMLPISEKLMEVKLALVNLLITKVIPVVTELYAKHWPAVSAAINDVVAFIETNWPKIQPIIEFAVQHVKTQIEGMIQTIEGIVQVVTGVIDLVSALFHGEWANAWTALGTIAEGALNILEGTIKRIFGALPGLVLDLAASLAREGFAAGKALADSIVNGIGNLAQRVADKVSVAGVSLGDVARFAGGIDDRFRADGGPVRSGVPYIVGERGPELFVPRNSGTVVPNSQLSAGVTVNINGPVYARDEAEVRRTAGDIGWAISLRRAGLSA